MIDKDEVNNLLIGHNIQNDGYSKDPEFISNSSRELLKQQVSVISYLEMIIDFSFWLIFLTAHVQCIHIEQFNG